MMSTGESPNGCPAILGQLGRKRRKLGGTLQRVGASPRIGVPQCEIRPAAARQPKGPYPTVPETVVDRRPPIPQRPITASAVALLELYYRLNTFVMAIEEKAPVEWAAKCILGVRKRRAYTILREIDAHGNLEEWFRHQALLGMGRSRIGRGRGTRPSALADAFFIVLAGGKSEARSSIRCLAGSASRLGRGSGR